MEGSPCVGVCRIGDEGFCLGCFRSRLEVQLWTRFTDIRKREIKSECRMRAALYGEDNDKD